jgi:oxalate decarboxylase
MMGDMSDATPSIPTQPDTGAGFRHRPTPLGDTHKFGLTGAEAAKYDGGQLQGANEKNWPILVDQQCAVYLVHLEPGGVREPHWHPSAWEVNYVISGHTRWTFVGPDSTEEAFEAKQGDVIFAPQGHFHYFENASDTEELVVLIVFNSSAAEPDDDIGIVQSFSSLPSWVLAASFGAPAELFDAIPKKHERVVISRRPES